MSAGLRWGSLARIVPIAAAVALGIAIGTTSPESGKVLAPFGQLYLSLLLMCVIPIIGAAVVSSLGRMVANHKLGRNLVVVALIFWFGMLLAATVGVTVGGLMGVGENLRSSDALGDLLLSRESTSAGPAFDERGVVADHGHEVELFGGVSAPPVYPDDVAGDDELPPRILSYLDALIPGNLMVAYLEDNYLAVLFFSILLGVALGLAPAEKRELTLGVVEALFDSLVRIISWIILLLPAGLLCIVAGQVAMGGLQFIPVFRRVILASLATSAIAMALFTLTIRQITGVRAADVLRGMREPLLVAFATSSSFASIPSALVALKRHFGLRRESANLFLPLGITMNPIGSALFFSLSAIFAVHLHREASLLGEPGSVLLLIVGAVLAGVASMGLPGASALWMLTIVLEPLGVPSEVGIIVLIAVAPIIDPLFTMVNVFGNCTASCLLDRYLGDSPHLPAEGG